VNQDSDFEKDLEAAFAFLATEFDLDHDDLIDDPPEVITPEALVTISLPRSEPTLELTFSALLELVQELRAAELLSSGECLTSRRFFVRVQEASLESMRLLESFEAVEHRLDSVSKIGDIPVQCSLVRGVTPFGFMVVRSGNWDKRYPPILDEDLFVQVAFDRSIPLDACRGLVAAYIFELSSSLSLDLVGEPRATYVPYDQETESTSPPPIGPRLRPLMVGKGVSDVLQLYNRALGLPEHDLQILLYTKAIEYVSQTVVRQIITDVVSTKLSGKRALEPDAEFVRELEATFEEQRRFRTDRDALKLTLTVCCDPVELARNSPPFLTELKSITATSKVKDRESALTQLGEAVASTRNLMAHAKPAYTPTGNECPDDQLSQFSECLRLAAQQVVRWYCGRHERFRIA
jgi:hypothetical protein